MINTTSNRILIYAPGIHTGGGQVLLDELVNTVSLLCPEEFCFYFDRRYKPPETSSVDHQAIPVGLLGRLVLELNLAIFRGTKKFLGILSFSNFPLIVKPNCSSVVYMQNRLIIDGRKIKGYGFKKRLRNFLQFSLFKLLKKNTDLFYVQTESMKNALCDVKVQRPIFILPFLPASYSSNFLPQAGMKKKYDFIYVTSDEHHKNHSIIFDALRLLKSSGSFPSVCMTTEQDSKIDIEIQSMRNGEGIQIYSKMPANLKEIADLYRDSRALIYPSLCESFGLPLLEASFCKIPIIGADLDYIDEYVQPISKFNPFSPNSLAESMSSFLNGEYDDHSFDYKAEISTGAEFLSSLKSHIINLGDSN